jgi:hypothetical protein
MWWFNKNCRKSILEFTKVIEEDDEYMVVLQQKRKFEECKI